MRIILIHGIWDKPSVFTTMTTALEADGHACFAPALAPDIRRCGLAELTRSIERPVRDFAHGVPVAFIGFSMGTLVTLQYLKTHEFGPQCAFLFLISGPLGGTCMAYAWPGKAARDMRPGSPFLQALNEDLGFLRTTETHTYRTPLDLLIFPSGRSTLAGARNHSFTVYSHRAMLKAPPVIRHIRSTISGEQAKA